MHLDHTTLIFSCHNASTLWEVLAAIVGQAELFSPSKHHQAVVCLIEHLVHLGKNK